VAGKKIHFAMIEAGGGHKTPALAVSEALEELFPGKYQIKILDFMKDLGCTDLDDAHKKLWKYLLKHPELTKSIQTFDFITGPVNIQIYKLFLDRIAKYVMRYLYNEKPELVFSTHYFNTMSIAHIRKTYQIGPILINYLTEIFDFDSYWYLKNVDHYIVASEQAEKKLLKKKFPREKLHLFPYPVRKSFFDIRRSRTEVLDSLGLDNDKKTLLITLGSEGIGSIYKMIEALVKKSFPLNVIAVAGKNEKLRQQLEREFGSGVRETNIVALGFQDRINELIYASDFCYIKPGPATTWEVLSMKKPIIFFESAQLSENPNIKFVVNNRLGYYAGNMPRKLCQIVDWFLGGYGLQECRRAYEDITINNGSAAIARFLDQVLKGE
jgi:UDP-N-acetylglucosamine:LPS N-acetylglucosamine transferase